MDLVIQGGSVLDGSGRSAVTADVGVSNGRVVALGRGLGRGREVINATGRVVAPGFIDIHTHCDFTLPIRPAAEARIAQGFTTDVTGNCGLSPFPLQDEPSAREHGAFLEPALSKRWDSLDAFATAIEDARPALNVAPLVGLGAIRLGVMGEEERIAGVREIAEMRRRVELALSQGAFGASSGLVYVPSSFADASELGAVLAPLGTRGRFYASHIRDEADGLLVAVEEALEVGRRAGCSVQLSHHKAVGRRNWGTVAETLHRIDDANASGEDVWLDVYPYNAASTTLSVLIPADARAGGEASLRSRLANPTQRKEIASSVRACTQFELNDVVLAIVPSCVEWQGRRLVDVAAIEGIDAAELALRLVEADGTRVVMLVFGMAEADVRRVLTHDRAVVGSDAWLMSTDGAEHSHLRNFGCSPRLLGHYVRDEGLLTLPQAVRKMTALPAARLGLSDRGVIRSGAVADLVIFDHTVIAEGSGYGERAAYPRGIEHVFVGGVPVVRNGMVTGERPGRILRASESAHRAPKIPAVRG